MLASKLFHGSNKAWCQNKFNRIFSSFQLIQIIFFASPKCNPKKRFEEFLPQNTGTNNSQIIVHKKINCTIRINTMLILTDLFEKKFSKIFGNWRKQPTLVHTLQIVSNQFVFFLIQNPLNYHPIIPLDWRLFYSPYPLERTFVLMSAERLLLN